VNNLPTVVTWTGWELNRGPLSLESNAQLLSHQEHC